MMTRNELLNFINLKTEFIPFGKNNRPGTAIVPLYITIHNTSNSNAGANAIKHSKFVRDTGFYGLKGKKHWVSWHYTVDDNIVIQQLPNNELAYHAGSAANNGSIAIEICMHKGIDQKSADLRAANLTALLCFDLKIPVANIVPHKHWTGKNCPELLLNNWNEYIERVRSVLKQLNQLQSEVTLLARKVNTKSNELAVPLCWGNDQPLIERDFDLSFSPQVQFSFNKDFLDGEFVDLPILPQDQRDHEAHLFIHHQNMSIYFNKNRKLALYTACNYNKDAFQKNVPRSNDFREDNIESNKQLGQGFYLSSENDDNAYKNHFDRGHLIAKRYNQWGNTIEEAKNGERETFVFTNIVPQVRDLNQDEWNSLESFIIEKDKLNVKKVSIFAGTILSENDPIAMYKDYFYKENNHIQIPLVFWKIVYYLVDGEKRKIAFLMSQKHKVSSLNFVKPRGDNESILDPFSAIRNDLTTYIVHSSLIEKHTRLKFTECNELYTKQEPLEVLIDDNETYDEFFGMPKTNFDHLI